MSGGLVALLDDIAALARIAAASVDDVAAGAAKAGAKAAGVVIDDAAVTPQYVSGADPSRELPMIKKIFWGSLRNKLLIILPALLLISAFIPGVIPFILMLGGTYLCYEGAEKVWHKLRGHHEAEEDTPAVDRGPEAEAKVTKGAITTDFILSCEIMVIAMNEVAAESMWARAAILVVVALAITVAVYGAVALIVKMDDIGLHLTTKDSAGSKRFGELLVKGMPAVLTTITVIGTVAMLWVGGHIMLQGAYDLGWHAAVRPGPRPRGTVRRDRGGGRLPGLAREHPVLGRPRSRLGPGRHGYPAPAAQSAAVRQEEERARRGRRPRRRRRPSAGKARRRSRLLAVSPS